jgi:hypothetical protein
MRASGIRFSSCARSHGIALKYTFYFFESYDMKNAGNKGLNGLLEEE